jgi:CTP:molybdopterin cytidylyltransferase MocA
MTTRSLKHAAIVLAAGASRRLGVTKQLVRIDGEVLVRRAVHAVLATEPARTLVIVGNDADAVFAAVADLAVERIDCSGWAGGMGASLRAGIDALHDECDGALVVLCDQAALAAAHLQALVATWRSAPERAVASGYAHTLGVPALLPRAWFAELNKIHGDHGARELLRNRESAVTAVAAPQLERDLDTLQDLSALSQSVQQ